MYQAVTSSCKGKRPYHCPTRANLDNVKRESPALNSASQRLWEIESPREAIRYG